MPTEGVLYDIYSGSLRHFYFSDDFRYVFDLQKHHGKEHKKRQTLTVLIIRTSS
jgi:hypothetical protein